MTLTVVTASYAPDFEGFVRLHRSVTRNTDDDVRHVVAVPDAHAALFRSLRSARLDVLPYGEILPRRFLQTSWTAHVPRLPRGYRFAAMNLRRPWPPVRGWIFQQVVKLAVTARLTSDVATLIDSDVIVVRPLVESAFRDSSGTVRLYRLPHGINPTMTRHVAERAKAAALLGIDKLEAESPDYISAFATWDPALVRACLARIEQTTNRSWWDVVAGSLDFSEFLTYGAFVMTVAPPTARTFTSERSLCHSHWDPHPLTLDAARLFVDALRPDDVAIHVQSNSSTDDAVLRYVAEAAERA